MRRLKQLNSTFLIAVDLSFKFDRPGRIMHAKFDVVSDVAFACTEQLIYPFYRLLSSSLRTGNYFAPKTTCNAYKCDEIGHISFIPCQFRQKSENMRWDPSPDGT